MGSWESTVLFKGGRCGSQAPEQTWQENLEKRDFGLLLHPLS